MTKCWMWHFYVEDKKHKQAKVNKFYLNPIMVIARWN